MGMVLGIPVTSRSGLPVFNSHFGGRWLERGGSPIIIQNPATGEPIGVIETGLVDWNAAVSHARSVGVKNLRGMSLEERAEMLARIARVISDSGHRDALIKASQMFGGKTYQDAKADIDGAALVYQYYAELGRKLAAGGGRTGTTPFTLQGNRKYAGVTVRVEEGEIKIVPDSGVSTISLERENETIALLIDAFNFPIWGPHHKAAAALLAGTPVISKPATVTAPVAHLLMKFLVESEVLPEGALQLVLGPIEQGAYQLFQKGDVVAFTGSGRVAQILRDHPLITPRGLKLNIEKDSVNAIVLAEDVEIDSSVYRMFVRHAAQETAENNKGERCTAPSKIVVLGPEERRRRVTQDIVAEMGMITVGNPADGNDVKMGPLASLAQKEAAIAGLRAMLDAGAQILYGTEDAAVQNWHGGRALEGGAFVGPVLLEVADPFAKPLFHEVEVFAPFPILMGQEGGIETGIELTNRGGPKLVAAVYTNDGETARKFIAGTAPTHGRILVVDENAVTDTPVGKFGPGTPWPELLHSIPGQGVELGGPRGLTLFTEDSIAPGSDVHGSPRFFRREVFPT